MNDRVVIMAKWPLLGRVKTRLAAQTSGTFAFEIYRSLFEHAVRFWQQSPFHATLYLDGAPQLPATGLPSIRQVNGHLGARMHAAVLEQRDAGGEKILVVGTDCPGMSHELIQRAYNCLDYADVVLGPAFDGGYYLIGVRKDCPELFGALDWGTSGVLSHSIKLCRSFGYSVVTLNMMRDLDTLDDFQALLREEDPWAMSMMESHGDLITLFTHRIRT
jgi:uncharacterized protein